MAKQHDDLQRQCFLWIWNERPELRYLCFSTTNNLTTSLEGKKGAIRMSQMKALGTVKGTTDLVFFYNCRLYGFDMKVGNDRLSKDQKSFIAAIRKQGGDGCEIRRLDEFKMQVNSIISNGKLIK